MRQAAYLLAERRKPPGFRTVKPDGLRRAAANEAAWAQRPEAFKYSKPSPSKGLTKPY
jgi:hypothetical protein